MSTKSSRQQTARFAAKKREWNKESVKANSDEYNQGKFARLIGKSKDSNPYPQYDTTRYTDWVWGWTDGVEVSF